VGRTPSEPNYKIRPATRENRGKLRILSNTFNYGHPAGPLNSDDADAVLFQVILDEASGNITDEKQSIVLTANGNPTYSQVATGSWANLSPGIALDGTGDFFANVGLTGELDLGASDNFTVEYVYSSTDQASGQNMVLVLSNSGTTARVYVNHRVGDNVITLFVQDDIANQVSASFTITAAQANDGNIHKVRVTRADAGNAQAFWDGQSLGIEGTANVTGAFTFDEVTVVAFEDGTLELDATLYEVRFSKNLTNNSGGPGGG